MDGVHPTLPINSRVLSISPSLRRIVRERMRTLQSNWRFCLRSLRPKKMCAACRLGPPSFVAYTGHDMKIQETT